MKASEHALAAAELLERDGWCQKAQRDGRGHRCLMAAIAEVDAANRVRWPIVGASYWELSAALVHHFGHLIVHWNDNIAISLADVTAALRTVAAQLQERGR